MPSSFLGRRLSLPQVLTGCGTSLHAAMYAAKLMRDFEAFRTCMALDSAEVRQSDLPKHVS